MRHPLVSIIITAYNKVDTIGKAIESAINQTYHNLEIIVIDDASTDRTVVECIKYRKDITLVQNKQNVGIYTNRTNCLNHARGKYILFLDGDDYISKNAVTQCVRNAADNDADIVQMRMKRIFTRYNIATKYPSDYNSALAFEACLYNERFFPVTSCAKLYKRSIIEDADFINLEQFWGEDRVFNMSVIPNASKVTVENKAVYNYRWGGESNKEFSLSALDEYKNIFIIKKSWAETNDLSNAVPYIKRELLALLAYHTRRAIDSGKYSDSEILSYLQNELSDMFWKDFKVDANDIFTKNKYSIKRVIKRLIRQHLF